MAIEGGQQEGVTHEEASLHELPDVRRSESGRHYSLLEVT